MFERHGHVMKPMKAGSIKNLTIPVPRYSTKAADNEESGWETIDDEETVFSLLLRKNAQQLMRSSQCPFSAGNIVDECGIDGNNKIMYDILNGTLTDYEVKRFSTHATTPTEELECFIRALARPRRKDGTVITDFEWSYGVKEF